MSSPKSPWTKNCKRSIQEMRSARKRLSLSIRQLLKDCGEGVRISEKLADAHAGEVALLQQAQALLLQAGPALPEQLTKWERDLQGSIRAAERQQAEELQRHVGTAISQVCAGEAVQPLAEILDWNP